MIGRRIPDSPNGDGVVYLPGEYHRLAGTWYGCTPVGSVANLARHSVTEHDDGTITVSPSILVHGGRDDKDWHGYLERGVWREC